MTSKHVPCADAFGDSIKKYYSRKGKDWRTVGSSGKLNAIFRMLRRAFLAGSALILFSCTPASVLPPEQVVEQAIQAAHDVESARFVLTGTWEGDSPFGSSSQLTLASQGWMHRENKQLQATVKLEGTAAQQPLSIAADIIMAGPHEAYVKEQRIGQWWKLPSDTQTLGTEITPDPRLLELQLQSVRVVRDEGMTELHGKLHYHYALEIDKTKLLQFLRQSAQEQQQHFDAEQWEEALKNTEMAGAVWIDSERFNVGKLQWTLRGKSTEIPWNLSFEISFNDFNAAPVIVPPPGATDLPADSTLLMPSDAIPGTLTPEQQQDMIRSLLEQQ